MRKIIFLLPLLFITFAFSQVQRDTLKKAPNDTLLQGQKESNVVKEIQTVNKSKRPMISPTKAGLYSAVLPGLGQMYNRKYWKIPIVWGAVGTGVGIIIWNQHQYTRYRKAFIASLNGEPNEFSDIPGITPDILGRTQDQAKRQRDYAIALTAAVYILNIIDAVVDAQLAPMKNDPDLAFSPTIVRDANGFQKGKPGLTFLYKF